jgi:uroporphyrin-III C-methyltransferase
MDQKTNDFGLFIMGGGPGDPELITIKAFNVLKRADKNIYQVLTHK